MTNKRIYSPAVTKEILHKYGFKLSKSLGQNFLIDGNIIDNICTKAEITKKDYVLEIGPGIGTLTQELCERAGKVIAIELDKNLLPILDETLAGYDNVEIVQGDVLRIDLHSLFKDKLPEGKVKVVANLPYYITTPIVMRLLEERLNIDRIVVMVQKEVALRMIASPGNKSYGSLSVAVQYYSDANIIVNVPSSVFIPRPNVDSAVIMLKVYDEPKVEVKDEKLLFKVVKGAFGTRRKTLLNALSLSNLDMTKDEVKEVLTTCNIDPVRRGETLSIEEFAILADYIEGLEN